MIIENFFLLLLVGILWIWGINCLLGEGYIFEPIGMVLERVFGTWFCKALFLCPPCQSSVHGTIIFFWLGNMHWHNVFLYVVCLAGANYIIVELTPSKNEFYQDTIPPGESDQEHRS